MLNENIKCKMLRSFLSSYFIQLAVTVCVSVSFSISVRISFYLHWCESEDEDEDECVFSIFVSFSLAKIAYVTIIVGLNLLKANGDTSPMGICVNWARNRRESCWAKKKAFVDAGGVKSVNICVIDLKMSMIPKWFFHFRRKFLLFFCSLFTGILFVTFSYFSAFGIQDGGFEFSLI